MFGRTVDIDGTEVFIFCTPDTPYSEILMRAAAILRKEEMAEYRMSREKAEELTMRAM